MDFKRQIIDVPGNGMELARQIVITSRGWIRGVKGLGDTGCSLNIVFFLKILKYFELWSFSVLPW